MECPFELPVRYECHISKDKRIYWVSLVILDANNKVIEQVGGRCRPSTNVLTSHLQHIQENYKYIVQAINSHEKLVEALDEIEAVSCGEKQVAEDDSEGMGWIYKRIQALKEKP